MGELWGFLLSFWCIVAEILEAIAVRLLIKALLHDQLWRDNVIDLQCIALCRAMSG